MSQFTNMTFNQAMLHIAGYDIYLKYKDNCSEEWFNLPTSIHRTMHFNTAHRALHTTDRRMWHAWGTAFDALRDAGPFMDDLEKGSERWFINLGYAIYSMRTASGWLGNSRYVQSRMVRILKCIGDDAFEEAIDEQINDGNLSLNICEDCSNYCTDTTYTADNERICNDCREEHYCYDDYHSEWFHCDDAASATGPNGESWTVNCESNLNAFTWDDDEERYIHDDYCGDDDDSVIRGYHAHDDDFSLIDSPWTKANKRHFGVELEVESTRGNRNESAKNIYDWFETNRASNEQLLFEEDGSLSHGFEMISNPMGLDKHREIWKWLERKDLINNIRSHNTSTCGLHVHVSKKGLSALTISKAVCFVNNPSNQSLIKAIARRYGSGYCRAKHVTLAKGAQCGDKYEMINLGKRHTMEFRIFRGTLNYNAIQAALEFTNAVINFSAATSMEELNELKFLEFIYKPEQRMDTKFLRTYLEQRSSRIKDIVDRNVKPLYNLRIVKPEPVAIVPDEPAQAPPPRDRGSRLDNITYPEDVAPVNPNEASRQRAVMAEHLRRLEASVSRPIETPMYNTSYISSTPVSAPSTSYYIMDEFVTSINTPRAA